MSNIEKTPYVLYDNQCYLCTKFAKMIESALKMFWLIDKKYAFGGRAALCPLLKAIITSNKLEQVSVKIEDNCGYDCKTVKGVFIRSTSLLLNSKKIKID